MKAALWPYRASCAYALPGEPTGPAARAREGAFMPRLDFRFAFLSALLLSACTAQHAAGPRPTPTPLRNPLGIPLYAGAAVIAVQPLHQVVSTPQKRDSVFAGGAGTY